MIKALIDSLTDYHSAVETVYYGVAMVAAALAVWVYRGNARLERSRWASTVYEKFYESDHLKAVRDLLDAPPDSSEVNSLVMEQEARFTDYLNFFEYVAFLKRSRQLRGEDVSTLFGYYLGCLGRHSRVRNYIHDPANGYEEVRKLIALAK